MSTQARKAPASPAPPTQRSGVAAAVGRLANAREASILLAVLLIVAAATFKNPNFLFSTDGYRDLWLTPSLLMLVAIGQAVVLITRNVDLSVGSVLGLSAYLTGRLMVDLPGLPVVAVMAIAVAFGALLGFINGALVAFAKVPALVITLGTMYAYRGINVLWTGSSRIDASDMPKPFLKLGTAQVLTIPVLTIIAVIVLIMVAWWMRNTRAGRESYAIGSDPDAAVLYGLPVTRRVLTAFVLSGALSGFAGVLYAARYGSINSQAGSGWELDAIGAAVIGGVAIFGGVGTVWGAAIGAILLMTINRVLPVIGVPDFWQRSVVGVLIIGAIVLDRVLALRQHRKLIEGREDA